MLGESGGFEQVKVLRSQPVLLAMALLLGLGMTYYYYGLLLPLRQKDYRLTNAAAGNWSDLYPRWLGARELLLHGRNPYSPEMSADIQRGFYGRPLDTSNRGEPSDQESFAYPLYVVFLLAPSLSFSFPTVRLLFGIILVVITVASVFLWSRALRRRLNAGSTVLALLVAITSYPVLDGLHLQQLTLLVAALMAASMALLAGKRLFFAGVLLACATIKPQLVFVLLMGLAVWSFSRWRERKNLLAGFAVTQALLLAGAELLLPGWLGFWRQATQRYVAYVRPSMLNAILGARTGLVVAGVAVCLVLLLFWRFRQHEPGSQHFNFLLVSALLVPTLLAPNAGASKYNLVLLIPAALWLFSSGLALRPRSVFARFSWLLAFNGLLWQWLLALAVVFAVVILRHPLQHEATALAAAPEIAVYLFPLTLIPVLLSASFHLDEIADRTGQAQDQPLQLASHSQPAALPPRLPVRDQQAPSPTEQP